MPSPPIIPSTQTIVTPAIDAIVAARPNALGPMNARGRYFAVPTIIGAQTDVALARVVDEVQSGRLRFSRGDALVALAASEFGTSLPPQPQTALATIQMARWSGLLPAGVIRKGQRFSKQADPSASPLPIAAATYIARETVYVPQGQTWATVLAEAVSPGVAANIPIFANVLGTLNTTFSQPGTGLPVTVSVDDSTQFAVGDMFSVGIGGIYQVTRIIDGGTIDIVNTGALGNASLGTLVTFGQPYSKSNTQIQTPKALWDSNWFTSACEASGGSSGVTDPVLVAASKAYARGQFGPSDGALPAGALSQQSVRHSAFFRAGVLPYAQGYLADESWAGGSYWVSQVAQALASFPWIGFGCRVRLGTIVNVLTRVAATIMLKSTDDLNNTDDIDANVRAQIRAYFDGMPTDITPEGRADWYLFRLASLQSVVASADSRIGQCTNVVVTDAMTGATIAEPSATFGQVWSPSLNHYYVGTSATASDSTVTNTYIPPA